MIGYARVSTEDQNTGLQEDALVKAGCEKIFTEKASGAWRERPQLAKALEQARPGDTLVVWKLDRLARSTRQLINTVEDLQEKGIHFQCLQDNLDTSTPHGEFVFHVFAALAQFERSLIKARTMAGLAFAREQGRVGGRPKALSEDDLKAAKALLADPNITVNEVAKRINTSPATLYRYMPGGRVLFVQGE